MKALLAVYQLTSDWKNMQLLNKQLSVLFNESDGLPWYANNLMFGLVYSL